jgi:CDP-paratose 2-epimerase
MDLTLQPGSRIFITGAAGFVGSTLALELRRAAPRLSILGLDNLSRKGSERNVERLRSAGCEFIQGDIRDAALWASLPPSDWLIDCAANPSVLAGVDGKSSSFEVMDHNLIGTLQLLEYCKKHQAGFILLSTSRVYSIQALTELPVAIQGKAFACEGPGISESFSTNPPLSLYGMSKLCSEQLALEYGATFHFPVWINRCGVLAGAGQFGKPDQGIFAYWIHSWFEKKPLKFIGFDGSGAQVRDALHPRDLIPLLLLQMADPTRPVPKIQNIAGGLSNSMSLRQLSDWCEKRFGPRPVLIDPTPRPFDVPWMILDCTQAKANWNWQATTTLPSILREIADFAEQNPTWTTLCT